MSISNSFKGYETFFAAIRMFWQMVVRLFIVMLIFQIVLISFIIYFDHEKMFGKIEKEDLCLFRTYVSAKIAYGISPNKQTVSVRYDCEQKPILLNYVYFVSKFKPYVETRLNIIEKSILNLLALTALIYLILPLLLIYFSRKHKKDTEDKFIRGATIISSDKLKEMMLLKSPSNYNFKITNNIQIPLEIITRHCICLGKPGSGKTQLISRIIDQIIKSNFKAIIHDFKGDFISSFYDYKKHYIFSPLDKRHMGLKDIEMDLIEKCDELRVVDLDPSILEKYPIKFNNVSKDERIKTLFEYNTLIDIIDELVDSILPNSKLYSIKESKQKLQREIKGWSIFNELKSSIDIDAFCASLIPESASQDNFWPVSSRQLLGSILTYCIHNNITSYSELWKMVNLSNEQLLELFKNTPGCEEGVKLLTEAKTANNILAVMSNYTKPIKYLIGTEGNFSIKDWVKDADNDHRIIFLSNYAMIQETIRPFLSMFADFSIKTLLSLDDDLNRRLFFILDEFGELGKIQTIVPLLTGSRSKGGAGFILIQDTARINTTYGKDGCSTIVNACGNLISFAVKKEESEFTSDCFGSQEIHRSEESKSMGVDNISDSISISKQTVEKRLVMPSEITNLPTMNFFIQLTDYPVSRDQLEIINFQRKSQSYIGREDLLFRPKTGKNTGSIKDSSGGMDSSNNANNQTFLEKSSISDSEFKHFQSDDLLFSEIKPEEKVTEFGKKDISNFGESELIEDDDLKEKASSTITEITGDLPQESKVLNQEPNQVNSEKNRNDPEGMLF